MKRNTGIYIIIWVILSSIIMSAVDAVIKPEYITKSLIKILLFLVVPAIYFLRENKAESLKKLFIVKKASFFKAVIIGVGIYAVIIGGYFLTKGFIDFSSVVTGLTENHGVNGNNFIYVSLYISLINSFLEEFFFRGVGFINLKEAGGRKFSHMFSAGMFALYHTGMLAIMFDLWVLPILFAGLFAGGLIFNFLDEKEESIYTSWAVHMFANFGVNTVGFILFGIL
ncbi:MAG: CPBP family intramembrane metalloprotease [Clostridia bacterium]|nr:CPBP family intramembrane metalloprotease [Clostridia bacterium]